MASRHDRSGSETSIARNSKVELEILEELSPSQVLVSVRHINSTDEPLSVNQISVGWFPAPEPWLAYVLPL